MDQQVAAGRFRDTDDLFECAIRQLLDEPHRASRRLTALRNLGAGRSGLYDRVLLPSH
jgi:Arc/MetJ-type ribon-helix-helix transcriptional regulator